MIKPSSLKNKKYPAFIRNSSVIKKCGEIKKSFEEVGLPDFSENYSHECEVDIEKFVSALKNRLNDFPKLWRKYTYTGFAWGSHFALKTSLANLASKVTASSIKKGTKLVLPCKVEIPNYYRSKTITYKKGSSLIALLNSLTQDVEELTYCTTLLAPYTKLIDQAVDFELSWNKRLKVVFSTHSWDIATMSMRGISSCQAWGKRQSPCLIGSIIDPNMGVMYLTDGVAHKKYGARMLARAVVRLTMPSKKLSTKGIYVNVTPEENDKRFVYMENAYASFASGATQSSVFQTIFAKIINDKTAGNDASMRLLSKDKADKFSHGIPLTPQVRKTPEKYRSYRDSGLMYIPMIK